MVTKPRSKTVKATTSAAKKRNQSTSRASTGKKQKMKSASGNSDPPGRQVAAKRGVPVREAVAEALDTLMLYESRYGNRYAGRADRDAADAIRHYKGGNIKKGKDLDHLHGVGKGTVEKVDEFLETGKIQKLEDFKKDHGSLKSKEEQQTLKATAAEGKEVVGVQKHGSGEPDVHPLSAEDIKAISKAATALRRDKTKNDLHDILAANGGLVSGTKEELVQRCAEGRVLGGYPTCPMCPLGKLHFDRKTGLFQCPGYIPHGAKGPEDWIPCFFKGHLKRPKWKE